MDEGSRPGRLAQPAAPAPADPAPSVEASITVRSVVAGLGVGSILCCTNMYFGLQTGWVTMGSLQSALLGFGFFRLLRGRGWAAGFSAAENVIVQTTAVATATMPLAAGFVGIIPALQQLTPEENPPGGGVWLSPPQMLAWGAALAFFGVFFAVPLREQVIVREQLPFPSGTATAKVIAILHGTSIQDDDSAAEAAEPQPDEEAAARPALASAGEAAPAPANGHFMHHEAAGLLPRGARRARPGGVALPAAASASGLVSRSRSLPGRVRPGDEAHSSTLPLLDQCHSGDHLPCP
eukprot:jgi/Tetstr1/420711/TSEL_011794.t1